MRELIFNIREFLILGVSFVKTWQLKNFKFFEIQFDILTSVADEWFIFKLETRTKQDHEGVYFGITLFCLVYFGMTFYDSRHYDYDEDKI